jgi:hypothetical protein
MAHMGILFDNEMDETSAAGHNFHVRRTTSGDH